MQRSNRWHFPAGDLARDRWATVVDAGIPGWQHTGLKVGLLTPGTPLALAAGDTERLFVPLSGSFRIDVSGPGERSVELIGRHCVFDGPTDVFYLGAGRAASVSGTGRVAIAEAPTQVARPNRYIAREEVPVELRGAGRSSRQVHNFGTPEVLDADKLIVCEVITPAENWSSYPPHKHDEYRPGRESRLEEIYYFESAVARGMVAPVAVDPFGLFSASSSPAGQISIDARVHSGDVALVPFGYHGPAVAAPGYDLYYLNVMAGPDPDRVWQITDDPAHEWVRQGWQGHDFDARLPYLPDSNGDHR